jgi:2-polyprenyl-3-methyl-5-hydroxy-6-metoxy-1,4-benzoquinol methylase
MQLPNFGTLRRVDRVLENEMARGKRCPFNVLDYGCGAADPALYLRSQGCHLTICDVEGGNLDAALKRFELRHLGVSAVGATAENPVPSFSTEFDIIIALEVLEHIRYPVRFLQTMWDSLVDGGILMLGSFPFKGTNTSGDHLEEAVSARKDLQQWIDEHFELIEFPGVGNSLRKARR